MLDAEIKAKVTPIPYSIRNGRGIRDINATLSLTSVLVRGGSQRHAPAALPKGKGAGTHCRGGWVGSRSGQDGHGEKKTPCPHGGSIHPASSQSLY